MNRSPTQSKSQLARQLTEWVSQSSAIRLAILFGSQAHTEQQKHFSSDVDLAIVVP
ncbi:nucleotidyltransferase domain-containing protein [Nitrosomonas aestuarii]|uniref:nucleotidyltransferase domain-containing protein n=1 Tax=Nitrosomonas aestuarii TaxID=52441 RepID=UPI0011145993|nr:nucleotidyltransferase domain-containing protein [Nitrosomonas aestuarii]